MWGLKLIDCPNDGRGIDLSRSRKQKKKKKKEMRQYFDIYFPSTHHPLTQKKPLKFRCKFHACFFRASHQLSGGGRGVKGSFSLLFSPLSLSLTCRDSSWIWPLLDDGGRRWELVQPPCQVDSCGVREKSAVRTVLWNLKLRFKFCPELTLSNGQLLTKQTANLTFFSEQNPVEFFFSCLGIGSFRVL